MREQAARAKRPTPDGGYGEVPHTKMRNGMPPSARMRVEHLDGSEAGWTDEGDGY
jgi:hypothetical protein